MCTETDKPNERAKAAVPHENIKISTQNFMEGSKLKLIHITDNLNNYLDFQMF